MDMFKEYGITKEEVYDVLENFDIYYNIQNMDLQKIRNELSRIVFMIDNEEIETEYNADDIFNIIVVLERIEEDGLTIEDFIK